MNNPTSRIIYPMARMITDDFDAIGLRWLAERALRSVLAALSLILFVRHLAGALTESLPLSGLIALAIAVALLVAAIRFVERRETSGWHQLQLWLPCVLVVILTISVSVPGSSILGLASLWAIVLADVSFLAAGRTSSATQPRTSDNATAASSTESATIDLRQHLTRGLDANGVDLLEGELHIPFADSQRAAQFDVAFCPPFDDVPEFDFEQVDGPEARIDVAQLLPHGARLELKLSQPGPARVTVAISARSVADVESD